MEKILIINGPNLNMLGKREPKIYGKTTLLDIEKKIREEAEKLALQVNFFQSNSESKIIDKIQQDGFSHNGIIINPAAFTHTSIAIRDALIILDIPIIEVHISNIYKRKEFRHKSFIADIATGQITGFGGYSYIMAIWAMKEILKIK